MVEDIDDWFTQTKADTLRATSIQGGSDTDKSVSPVAEDVYLARDTGILYVCFVSGVWTNIGILYLLLAGGTMSGAIAMGTNKLTGLGAPTSDNDAARKKYVDDADALRLLLAGGTMSGAIAMGTHKITGLDAPTANADAVTKAYADALVVPGLANVAIGSSTRSASGDQAITGLGFKPKVVIFHARDTGGTYQILSTGFDDGTNHNCVFLRGSLVDTGHASSLSIYVHKDINNQLYGYISSLDADGFTLTWVEVGTISADFDYLAMK